MTSPSRVTRRMRAGTRLVPDPDAAAVLKVPGGHGTRARGRKGSAYPTLTPEPRSRARHEPRPTRGAWKWARVGPGLTFSCRRTSASPEVRAKARRRSRDPGPNPAFD